MNWLDFGVARSKVKGHRAHYVCKIACDRVISRTHWWISAKLGSCMYLAEPMNWLDFGVTRSKVKGHRAHYVCKIACDHVISRTHWWIPAKLGSCMYLAQPINWLDFGLTRSKVKGHIMYAKMLVNVFSRTHCWIPPNLGHICTVPCRANELIRFWGHEIQGQRSQGSLCMQK